MAEVPGDGAPTAPVGEAAIAGALARGAALAPGTVLAGRYRVERLLASGGMGAVYVAADLELGVDVALKTIRPDLAWTPSTIEQFKREIQLARSVTHPGVCRIFDLGRHGTGDAALVFLTMELLDGETLAQRIARGRVSGREAATIAREIASALAAAHAAGVVHLDLKPANVVLAGRAVVTDFGLARPIEDATAASVAGTPAYMAPEQRRGGAIGPPADVWAFGVLLHEMLAGPLPDAEAARAPGLGAPWDAVLRRCLAPDPIARFASGAELAAALAPASPRGRRRVALVGAGVAAAGALAIAAWALGAGGAPASRAADEPRDAEAARAWRAGVERLREGDEAAAAAHLRRAVAAEPTFALAHAELSAALRALGDRRGARAEAEAAAAHSATLGREHAAVVAARGHEAEDSWERAIELYGELRAMAPGEREYLLRLGHAQIQAGRLRDARATLDALAAGPPHPRVDMLEAFHASRGRDWNALLAASRRAARAADEVGAKRLAALAWTEQGVAHMNLGAVDDARAAFEEADRRFRAQGDRAGVARVLIHRAELAAQLGDPATARAQLDEALTLYRELEHRDGQARALVGLALNTAPDRLVDAVARYREAIALYREGGDRANAMTAQLNLASAHYKLGDHAAFRATLDEVLATARELGDSWTTAAAAANLALVTLAEADPPRAQVLLDEARTAARVVADPTIDAYVHWGTGEVALARADRAAARRELAAAVALAPRVADPAPVEQARCALARAGEGDVADACAAASAALEAAGYPDDGVALAAHVLRAQLARRDRRAAAATLDRIRALAAASHDRHTALIARMAAAEVAAGADADADADAVGALDGVAAEAAAIRARGLALEARYAMARLQRARGDTRTARATLVALEAEAIAHGMAELAERCRADLSRR